MLSAAEKDALILAQAAQLREAFARIAELEKRLNDLLSPPKTPDNSSLPPSKGQKPNRPDKPKPKGPREGSIGGSVANLAVGLRRGYERPRQMARAQEWGTSRGGTSRGR